MKNELNMKKLYEEKLGDKIGEYKFPPPSYMLMHTEITEYDKENMVLETKMPVKEIFLNAFGTMQGGLIVAAMDNAIGALGMLIAPLNVTRNIESKLIKAISMETEVIYTTAKLMEYKKRRLTFDVEVKDKNGTVYAKATIINWILEENK